MADLPNIATHVTSEEGGRNNNENNKWEALGENDGKSDLDQ